MQTTLTPPLKWAGGKRWLVPLLKKVYQKTPERRLVEPFVGGMSVALGLSPASALLNDANSHLVNFYLSLQKGLTSQTAFGNDEAQYYLARERFNELIKAQKADTQEAAQLFYYLMRTGFNGLCRFNRSGLFNVPFGRYKTINYRRDFDEYRQKLKYWQIQCGDFADIELRGEDFLYIDPPYDVEFTQYHATDFKWQDQIRLVEWLEGVECPTIISNQATLRVLKLYRRSGFKLYQVQAPRMISCNGDRTKAIEVLAVKNLTRSQTREFNLALEPITRLTAAASS